MSRGMRPAEVQRRSKARRERALIRNELKYATEDRVAPAGPTSMTLKARNAADDLLIEAYMALKKEEAE